LQFSVIIAWMLDAEDCMSLKTTNLAMKLHQQKHKKIMKSILLNLQKTFPWYHVRHYWVGGEISIFAQVTNCNSVLSKYSKATSEKNMFEPPKISYNFINAFLLTPYKRKTFLCHFC
jgi:hypothetical protein